MNLNIFPNDYTMDNNKTIDNNKKFINCKKEYCNEYIKLKNPIEPSSKLNIDKLLNNEDIKNKYNCFCSNCIKEIKEKFKTDIIYINKYLKKYYNKKQLNIYNDFLILKKKKDIKDALLLNIYLDNINKKIVFELHIKYWNKNIKLITKNTYLKKLELFKKLFEKNKKNINKLYTLLYDINSHIISNIGKNTMIKAINKKINLNNN